MGSEASSSNSNSDACSNVNEYIKDKRIVSCSLGLSQLSTENIKGVVGNFLGGKNYVHAALWLSDKDFENTDEKGILIEYGNYQQEVETNFIFNENGKREEIKIEKKYVIYHYKEKGGLRYYIKNYEDYKKIFATTAYVDLDIANENQIMFNDFIQKCAPIEKNEWIKNNYDFLNYNCQHFTAHALKILSPIYKPKDIQIIDKKNAGPKRETIIPSCILKILKKNN